MSIADQGGEVIRILLALILLVVGLTGCNFPVTPGRGIMSAPTNDLQMSGQVAEATGESTAAPIEIVPIPVSSIQIEGVPYQAYQIRLPGAMPT
jgi:hypothetical protein